MRFPFDIMPLLLACVAGAVHAQDYAAWKNANEDGTWTAIAESAVKATQLSMLAPKDIGAFCPTYEGLDQSKRVRFWVGLLSAMAQHESRFKPHAKYVEPAIVGANNRNVVSRGLLQISMESANQKAYDCGIRQAGDLHKVEVNLNCAARIMQHWVQKDGLIAAASQPAVGAARYWSVLRAWKGPLGEITTFTRSMNICSS